MLVEDFRGLLGEIADGQRLAGLDITEDEAQKLAVEEVRALRLARRAR